MQDETNKAQTIRENRTRAQKAKEIHERKQKERKQEADDVTMLFAAHINNPLVQHLLFKAREFANYHTKLAKDGVGARKTGFKLENGGDEVENYFLTQENRVSNLDKAAGIEEIIDYVDRKVVAAKAKITLPEAEAENEEPQDAEAPQEEAA